MSMALKALGYSKTAAGTFVKAGSIAPDKAGDLLILLGTKLKNMAAAIRVSGEGIKFNGTVDLMVARGEITGEEVAAYAESHNVSVDTALKAVALEKLGDKLIKEERVAANQEDKDKTVIENPTVNTDNSVGVVSGAVAKPSVVSSVDDEKKVAAGPTVIAVNTGSSSVASTTGGTKVSVGVSGTVTAAGTAASSVASASASSAAASVASSTGTVDTPVSAVNNQEEIPAHVLALELC